MFILGLISGILLGGGGLFAWAYIADKRDKKKAKLKQKKYIKRGLYTGEFTRGSGTPHEVDYDVTAEVGIVERTKTKIKIEVIDLKTSISSNTSSIEQITNIIEGWRNANDSQIEWFEPHPEDVRNNKIDDILN
jgi:hypothetical protein